VSEESKPAFTPGPWERYGFIGRNTGLNRVRAASHVDRVERKVYVDVPANADDARLIAAAPDLYAACIAAQQVIRANVPESHFDGYAAQALDLLRAAIAKAEGK
jgi:hypothetical protein